MDHLSIYSYTSIFISLSLSVSPNVFVTWSKPNNQNCYDVYVCFFLNSEELVGLHGIFFVIAGKKGVFENHRHSHQQETSSALSPVRQCFRAAYYGTKGPAMLLKYKQTFCVLQSVRSGCHIALDYCYFSVFCFQVLADACYRCWNLQLLLCGRKINMKKKQIKCLLCVLNGFLLAFFCPLEEAL